MHILNQVLTEEDKKWCRGWSNKSSYIIACLTSDKEFNEISLNKLIYYEATHHKRIELMARMMARRSKLIRKREWAEIVQFISGE